MDVFAFVDVTARLVDARSSLVGAMIEEMSFNLRFQLTHKIATAIIYKAEGCPQAEGV